MMLDPWKSLMSGSVEQHHSYNSPFTFDVVFKATNLLSTAPLLASDMPEI